MKSHSAKSPTSKDENILKKTCIQYTATVTRLEFWSVTQSIVVM